MPLRSKRIRLLTESKVASEVVAGAPAVLAGRTQDNTITA